MNGHPQSRAFDVYGFRFSVSGTSAAAIEGVGSDFTFFRAEPAGDEVTIEILDQEPDYGRLPVCDASIYTPRNTVYRSGSLSYLDYHGKGLGVHEPGKRSFRIISRDVHLLYEATYLFLLSQIGQALDLKGLHRLHALAMSLNGRAILVLLPMGGGKSTLGAHLLRHPELKMLSDDSPFVDSSGRAHAFPLHLGLLAGSEGEVPERHRRFVNRMEFGPKFLVNFDYFADRVSPSAEPGIVFLGSRTLSRECRIEPAGMRAGLRSVVANGVIGMGLFHGLEFILESSPWEILTKTKLGWSRLSTFVRLLRRSRVCRLHLGRDPEANAAAVVEFSRGVLG
ncbi:MAG TPA: hypothetical protein VLH09_07760 [Bryobacteraceae bacterium]|nr:hypothetical protein [Bryobacteraceae bacterium]